MICKNNFIVKIVAEEVVVVVIIIEYPTITQTINVHSIVYMKNL
jgi:hypothetical protein